VLYYVHCILVCAADMGILFLPKQALICWFVLLIWVVYSFPNRLSYVVTSNNMYLKRMSSVLL